MKTRLTASIASLWLIALIACKRQENPPVELSNSPPPPAPGAANSVAGNCQSEYTTAQGQLDINGSLQAMPFLQPCFGAQQQKNRGPEYLQKVLSSAACAQLNSLFPEPANLPQCHNPNGEFIFP